MSWTQVIIAAMAARKLVTSTVIVPPPHTPLLLQKGKVAKEERDEKVQAPAEKGDQAPEKEKAQKVKRAKEVTELLAVQSNQGAEKVVEIMITMLRKSILTIVFSTYRKAPLHLHLLRGLSRVLLPTKRAPRRRVTLAHLLGLTLTLMSQHTYLCVPTVLGCRV